MMNLYKAVMERRLDLTESWLRYVEKKLSFAESREDVVYGLESAEYHMNWARELLVEGKSAMEGAGSEEVLGRELRKRFEAVGERLWYDTKAFREGG